MSGFPSESSTNQAKCFSSGLKIFRSYAETNGDLQTYNQIVNFSPNGEISEFHQATNTVIENKHQCDNCSLYIDQIQGLQQENDLLTQLVGNLRSRIRDIQTLSLLNSKTESSLGAGGIKRITNGEPTANSTLNYNAREFDPKESKIVITRLTSELEFFKALNANTEVCWLKKFEENKATHNQMIKRLEEALHIGQDEISRLSEELENITYEKEEAVNKTKNELTIAQSRLHVLTSEFEHLRKEKENEINSLNEILVESEERLSQSQKKIDGLVNEFEMMKLKNQETIDELNQKLAQAEIVKEKKQAHIKELLGELAMTKLNCQLTITKLTKELNKNENDEFHETE